MSEHDRDLESDRDQWQPIETGDIAAAAEQADSAVISPRYPNAADWVEGWLLEHFRRDTPGFRWCCYWWDHAEAASRLEAMWQAWEAARADADNVSAISHWWLHHCDPQMAVLASSTGPFLHCDPATGEHRLPNRLPVTAPPEGMYRAWSHPEEAPYA